MGCTSSSSKRLHNEKLGAKYFLKNKRKKGNTRTEKVELYFSCVNTNQDLSNLKVVLSYSINPNHDYREIGQTEELQFGSTTFITFFVLEYSFEINQYVKIELIQNNILIDTLTSSLGSIVGSRNNTLDLNVNKMGSNFSLRTIVRKAQEDSSLPRLYFCGTVTNNHNVPGDYYLLFMNNHTKANKWKKVFKTKEGTGPFFKLEMDQVNFNDICLSNPERPFKIQLRKFGAGIVGEQEITLNSLNKQNILNMGTFVLDLKYEFKPYLNFFNYLQSGLQISFMAAIDYTGSNQEYTNPRSLHYIYSEAPNQYEQAIRHCGSILSYYDYDQAFPVYGFGGEIDSSGEPSHFFNVNLTPNPAVYGIDGIINCYKNSLSKIRLSGPTYFAPLIKGVVKNIKEKFRHEGNTTNVYNVLLILTDGLILDMDETRKAICKAAKYPLSIIIVGIGDSQDLANMEELDGDGNQPLRNKKGKKISRDIVQFVKFNKYKNNPEKFAQELLCEIPYQIEEYFETYHTFDSTKIRLR